MGIWDQPETAAEHDSTVSLRHRKRASEAFLSSCTTPLRGSAVSSALGGVNEAMRAKLAATNLVGTAMLRYIMRVPPPSRLSR